MRKNRFLTLCVGGLWACGDGKQEGSGSSFEDTATQQQQDTGPGVDPSTYTDTDGDGYVDYDDCADDDPDIYPGADEIAYDGIDQDCDGEDLDDLDGDGYASEKAGGEDCDDEDSSINPDAFDDKNGIDDDCDGEIDDDYIPIYDTWPVGFGSKSGLAWGVSVGVDPDGNVFAMGGFLGEVDFDPEGDDYDERESDGKLSDTYVVKLTSDREKEWVSALLSTGQATGEDMVVDSEGMLAVAGSFTETVDVADGAPTYQIPAQEGSDAYVVRLDADGDVLWGVGFSGAGEESANSVDVTDDGVVVVVGQFSSDIDLDPSIDKAKDLHETTGGGGAFVVVLDQSGVFVWGRSISATDKKDGSVAAHSVIWGSDGTVYVAGEATGTVDLDPGDDQDLAEVSGSSGGFVVALDGDTGAYVWGSIFAGEDGAVGAAAVDETTDGTLVVGGWFSGDVSFGAEEEPVSASTGTDGFLVWMDSGGDTLGVEVIGGEGNDSVLDLQADGDGGVVLGGAFSDAMTIGKETLTVEGGTDNWAARVAADGSFSWLVAFGNGEEEGVMGVCSDGAGGGYMTGDYSGTVDFALTAEDESDERSSQGELEGYVHLAEFSE